MFFFIFSIVVGLLGLAIVAANLHRRHHIIAVAVLLLLMTTWVSHSELFGLVNSAKIVLLYGCFVAASARPKQVLFASGVAVCLNAALEIFASQITEGASLQLTKVVSLPSIGLFLLSCAVYPSHRMYAKALMVLGLIFALLNFTLVQYRSEAVLAASIGFCLLVFLLKLRAIGSAILFLPIVTSAIYFLIGSQFAVSLHIASLYTFSIEATASNFERSLFSFAILTSLFDYPFGQPMHEASYSLQDAAQAVGRAFYDSNVLDPHNFFLFFSTNLGFLGSCVFVLFLWRTFTRVVQAGPNENVFIEAILLAIAAVIMSFFPFSTEPRTIAAVCIGAALRMSFHHSAPVYRSHNASRYTYS